MAYTGNLTTGEQIQIENRGNQTVISLFKGGLNQQQSQGSSVETGSWSQPPTLFRTLTGVVLRVEAAQGQFFIQLQSGSISSLNTPPSLMDADILPLQQTPGAASDQDKMPPMRPMEPMQMGNMEMRMEPMQMRMGNMQMQMGKTESTSSSKRFCSQCGEKLNRGDRFCSSCGNQLTS